MADSRRKIVKDHWGSRTNFQASYGLRMRPEDLAEGDAILDAMRRFDAANLEGNDGDNKEAESGWVKTNRRRYEAAGRSGLKEGVVGQLAEEYNFTPTGDPEMDLIIAMGLRDMKGDAESSHTPQPAEPAVEVGAKSKQQRKRERKRESAKRHNQGTDPNKDKSEAEGQWVKTNRERYEAGGRSELKEAAARQMAEEHNFTSTGDPEMDLIIGMGLRDMKGDPEFGHTPKPGEGASSSLGGPAVGTGATKSKRQRKRERQRENERKRNQENDVGKETESEWVRNNRERYEAGGRSLLEEIAAEQWAEEYNFTQTGDPEMDMIIAMGLRDMKDDPEFSHTPQPAEPVVEVGAKSKQQRKRERQRENAGGRRWSAKELEEESRRLAELLRVHHA